MPSDSGPTDGTTPTRVTGEWVTVERTIERNREDVIATLAVTTQGDIPVSVEVHDAFPEEWSVRQVDVHPEFRPDDYIAESNRFQFTGIVAPGSSLKVVYGARIDAPESLTLPDPPVIQREQRLENASGAAGDSVEVDDGESIQDSDGESDLAVVAPSDRVERDRPAVWNSDVSEGEGDPTGPHHLSLSDAEADPTKQTDDTDPFGFENAGGEGSAGVTGLVEALAAELRSDSASGEAVATIRAALETGGSKRDEARLSHLQSRVEEFAAYASTLGDVLDEHGSLDGLLADYEARLDTLENDHGSVQTAIDEAGDAREALRERLDATTERVEAVEGLADDLETVRDEMDQLRQKYGNDLDTLEAALDALETNLGDAVDDLESDLERLETHVEDWEATRQQMAEALAADPEPREDGQQDASTDAASNQTKP